MRILHLANGLSMTGNGIVNVLVDLACEQASIGHDVHVASLSGGFEHLLRSRGVVHHAIDFGTRSPRSVTAAIQQLRSLTGSVQPDVMHAHVIGATLIAKLARPRTPLVATVHNEWQRGVGLMGFANRVVGVSTAVTLAMRRRGVPARRLRTVLNGVAGTPRREQNGALAVPELQHPAVVTLGSVSERKGSDLLFRAFELVLERFPEAHLYYVGNVDWVDFAQYVSRSSASKQVTFVGFDSQPQRFLKQADVFVFPSRQEPLGLALLEAMQAGCPIVATAVDGIPEALGNDGAGILVPSLDWREMGRQIERVLSNAELRSALQVAGQSRLTRFSVANMTQGYNTIYAELVKSAS